MADAGRPWRELSEHDYRVEMQRRRLRHCVERLARFREHAAAQERAREARLQEAVEKLRQVEEQADNLETEEAPALRQPCATGVSMLAAFFSFLAFQGSSNRVVELMSAIWFGCPKWYKTPTNNQVSFHKSGRGNLFKLVPNAHKESSQFLQVRLLQVVRC